MRKITVKVNVQATITVNAEDDVTTQDIEDGISIALDVEGADLSDSSIDGIELDVTDSR